MKPQLINKLKAAATCFVLFSGTIVLNAQDTLIIKGGCLKIINDTLKVNGNIVVKDSGSIHNAGVIYLTDSLINKKGNLFYSSSNPYLSDSTASPPVGTIIFSGNKKQYIIAGNDTNTIYFNNIILDNPHNLYLNTNIKAFGKVQLKNGNIDLNGHKIDLFDNSPAVNRDSGLLIESDYFRIVDSKKDSCGYVRAFSTYAPTTLKNIGNLGAEVSSGAEEITVERGHTPLFVVKDSSLAKFYNIYSTKSGSLDSIILHYHKSDFANKGYDASALSIFSTDLLKGTYFKKHSSTITPANQTVSAGKLNLLRRYLISNSGKICENPIQLFLPSDTSVCKGDSVKLDPKPKNNIGRDTFYTWYALGSSDPLDITRTYTPPKNSNNDVDIYVVKVSNEYGCTSFDTVRVHTRHLPSVKFQYHTFYCKNDSIHFTNASSIDQGALHYYWNFGDSSTSNEKDPVKKYNSSGTDSVSLRCISDYGCSVKIKNPIEIFNNPQADFTYEKVCRANTINCTNTSNPESGKIILSAWNFPGKIVTNSEEGAMGNASFTFATHGTYPVKLTVRNEDGNCTDSITKNVEILADDAPNFAVTSNCVNDSARFHITSHINSGNSTYTWDFGDSFISHEENPAHHYQAEGEYNASLSLQNNGCISNITKKVVIHAPADAGFTYDISCAGNKTGFHNNTSDSLQYIWYFDGITNNEPNPAFVFQTVGRHEAKLQVTSALGCESTETKDIEVLPTPLPDFDYSVVCYGYPTQFTNKSTLVSGNMTYQWNLNNENTSDAVNPSYTFKDSLNIITQLMATADNGCSSSITKNILVNQLPKTGLDDSIFTCGKTLPLLAEEANATYNWSNGKSDRENLITTTGKYYLTVTDAKGCVNTDSSYVELNSYVRVSIGDSLSGCESYKLAAHNYRSTYAWSTGSTDNYINVSASGIYKVTVTDINECTGSDSAYVRIDKMPVVNLGNDTFICEGNSIVLIAGTTGTSYLWSDKSTNSSMKVAKAGAYSVEVKNRTCSASDTINISVVVFLKPGFGESITACSNTVLDAGNNGCHYKWSEGDTTQTIRVNTSGNYWVEIEKYNCRDTDHVQVDILPSPYLALGSDKFKCKYDSVILDANDLGEGYRYLWNNSIQGPTIKTDTTGSYFVKVTGHNGCSSSDTISVFNYPLPDVNLQNEYYLCEKVEPLEAVEGYVTYRWNSDVGLAGSDRTIYVTEPGKYWVNVTSADGCSNGDTTIVKATTDTVTARFLVAGVFNEEDTAFRAGDTVYFTNISYPANAHYHWNFGDYVTSDSLQPYHIYYAEGTYTIQLTASTATCADTRTKTRTVKGYAGSWQKTKKIQQPKEDKNHSVEFISSKLYPNPAAEYITLDFEISAPSNLILYMFDINGRIIHFEKLNVESNYTKVFNLDGLKTGMYILKVITNRASITHKFIKVSY